MRDNKSGFTEPNGKFIENLPEIGPNDTFCFDCGPQQPCFNRCCADLALPLTPYDVLRLQRQLGIDYGELLRLFTQMRAFPDTGFPLPFLRMVEGPDAPCPFVGPAGCSVYVDRPGACRSYPLGRGAKMASAGVAERFFVVREEHCKGFENGTCRAPAQWFADQGLDIYNRFNDRYMRLISMVRATEKPLDFKMANMAILCLYQLDRFKEFIEKMGIFNHLEVAEEKKKLILSDSQEGYEARLNFAFDWLELVIFGKAENLAKKGE